MAHVKNLFATKNDLPDAIRTGMIELLNARLADAVDLQAQAKQAHWNVKGPQFIALHELFDEVAGAAVGYVDLIAERAVQLGGVAEGTLQVVVGRSSLKPYPDVVDGPAHAGALAGALATFGTGVRQAIAKADEAGDADTADIFTEISRGIDKFLWFVEAHLQA